MITLPEVAEAIGISVRSLQVEKARTDKRRRDGKPGRHDLPPSEGRAPLPERFRSDSPRGRKDSAAWRRRTIEPWIHERVARLGRD
ncbi:hypothetical protein GCM10027061_20370 [Nesterenkonia suensis]